MTTITPGVYPSLADLMAMSDDDDESFEYPEFETTDNKDYGAFVTLTEPVKEQNHELVKNIESLFLSDEYINIVGPSDCIIFNGLKDPFNEKDIRNIILFSDIHNSFDSKTTKFTAEHIESRNDILDSINTYYENSVKESVHEDTIIANIEIMLQQYINDIQISDNGILVNDLLVLLSRNTDECIDIFAEHSLKSDVTLSKKYSSFNGFLDLVVFLFAICSKSRDRAPDSFRTTFAKFANLCKKTFPSARYHRVDIRSNIHTHDYTEPIGVSDLYIAMHTANPLDQAWSSFNDKPLDYRKTLLEFIFLLVEEITSVTHNADVNTRQLYNHVRHGKHGNINELKIHGTFLTEQIRLIKKQFDKSIFSVSDESKKRFCENIKISMTASVGSFKDIGKYFNLYFTSVPMDLYTICRMFIRPGGWVASNNKSDYTPDKCMKFRYPKNSVVYLGANHTNTIATFMSGYFKESNIGRYSASPPNSRNIYVPIEGFGSLIKFKLPPDYHGAVVNNNKSVLTSITDYVLSIPTGMLSLVGITGDATTGKIQGGNPSDSQLTFNSICLPLILVALILLIFYVSREIYEIRKQLNKQRRLMLTHHRESRYIH